MMNVFMQEHFLYSKSYLLDFFARLIFKKRGTDGIDKKKSFATLSNFYC